MKRIVQLWFVLAVAVGTICAPVQAMDPEQEEGYQSAVATSVAGIANLHLSDSSKSPDQETIGHTMLEQLPQELFNKIVNLLDPKSIVSLSEASITCQTKVYEFYASHLVQTLGDESRRGLQDPMGRELPNMGLSFFDTESPGSRIGIALASVPLQDKDRILKSALNKFGFFAAKGGSRLASVAGTIEGLQHENMYKLILQALGESAQDLTYVQKSALQHQFLGCEVYYKVEVRKDAWLGSFNKVWAPEAGGGLLAFINNTYQEITAKTEAIDTDHYWVVRHSQLAGLKDHINDLLPANNGGPQPTIVIDIDAPRPEFHMSNNELSERLRNLVLTNADESVQTIGNYFLYDCIYLRTLNLNMPALKNVQVNFVVYWGTLTGSLQILNLNAPVLESVGRSFLTDYRLLQTLHLNVPALKSAGDRFLSDYKSLQTLNLYLPALEIVGDKSLSYCESLQTLNLNTPALLSIGEELLHGCESLNKLNLDVSKLESVGDYFLFHCKSLPTLNLNVPELKSVGPDFLSYCESLQEIYVPADQLERLRELFPENVKGLLRPAVGM